jgi:5-methylcytosine-specific restriction endonuclease McrA
MTVGITRLVEAITKPPANGVDRAALLAAVAQTREERPRRPTVKTRAAVAIFRRDSWTCRYCGVQTIAPPVLRFLGEAFPKEFPYHPNWKAGETHDAWLLISTSLGHLIPGARGGDWHTPENLVTNCWACNSAKADLLLDELGWNLLSEDDVRSDWDGLTGAVNALWVQAGSPESIFKNWRQALAT